MTKILPLLAIALETLSNICELKNSSGGQLIPTSEVLLSTSHKRASTCLPAVDPLAVGNWDSNSLTLFLQVPDKVQPILDGRFKLVVGSKTEPFGGNFQHLRIDFDRSNCAIWQEFMQK
ncbi:hypothetical protein HUJ05_004273 [Dendroctonus ponderosae]|nr:hypothetical protein HUJ05_004273 [Dendroctonus ponderosae]